jgi:hypothetical protein
MKSWWFGAVLTVVFVVGCEAKIEGRTSFSAQTGGDMMADGDDGDGEAGRASGAGSRSGNGGPSAGSGGGMRTSGSGGAQAGTGSQPMAGTGASGDGTGEPPTTPEPNPNVGGPYDLGELPAGFTIAWPAEPTITREVEVRTLDEFQEAASVEGTRVVIKADFGGNQGYAYVRASDVEVAMDPGVRVAAKLGIAGGSQRVRVLGGHYEGVMISSDLGENFCSDIMLDGITIESPTSAFELRGSRIAVIRSTVTAGEYSVYTDALHGDELNSDYIVAGNVFDSANEATVRLTSVINSVTVDNQLTNNGKHNYRVHGMSSRSFAARNVLITSGTLLGTMPGDALVEAWFNDNTFYHTTPDLFHPDAATVDVLHAHDNIAYTDVWTCFLCSSIPGTWDLQNNQIMAYRPPP